MLIVLQRHYFIKWDKRKVPGFKESYCYSSVLSYFACGKTRLRCRKLALNNKYTKSMITLKCFQLRTYVYDKSFLCDPNQIFLNHKIVELFPKNADMLLSKLATRNASLPDLGKKCLTYYFQFQKNIDFNQSGCPECR